MKKPHVLIVIIIVALLLSFFAFNNYIYQQKQGSGEPTDPYQGTLTGEYVCLPHRDTSGPQTLECAFGLLTKSGEYYALDFGENIVDAPFASGETDTLTGLITPIENLSSDHWQKYNVSGILSVEQ